ncbi:MAG: hypothetical protein RIC19_12145 [Phaeodactylibacter sp.]|uniref:PKD domain-containing protein n=1 Tax=Phaeodactylibacter sp. TaxID=1940289 RepID=UPI0032ECDA52
MPRNLKSILIAACCIAGVLLAGCKKDNNTNGDGLPPVLLVNGADVYEDTLKVSAGQLLELTYTIEDDQSNHTLLMSKLNGAVVKSGDFVLNNASLDAVPKTGTLTLQALEEGTHSFILSAEDPFGVSGTALVEVLAIGNYEPVAALSIAQLDEAAPYHVRINAGQSFDRDSAWGGGVLAYEFTLEGIYTVETERPELDYIYPGPGTYAVRVRVKDNDGVWSDSVRSTFTVE